MEPLRDDDPRSIGGYTLVCRLGSGGMGQVYLGESAAGFQVAVKVIKASVLDEDGRARFLLEVDSLKTVYGPFIASFVAADAHADRPWLAVEFVAGPDLLTYVSGHGPLPLVETASLGALLAEGLGTVHEAGLLHRDLKPQNILLSSYGPKVIDFGLAVLAERRSTLTATGVVVGSVLCMPPEQARGEHQLDHPADVYGLGAVLLYAATGHYPYTGPSWQAVALKIEDPATPPDLSGLPPELVLLVSDMLALDPAARPTLDQVTQRLVAVIADRGLTAARAKRRLTDRAPAVEVPEPPATDDLPEGWTGYTPTVVDVAAWENDETPDTEGDAEPGDDRSEAPSETPPAETPVPSAASAPGGAASARTGVRPSAPVRIAEQLRAAYAREARF
ncbi:serine/threonine protein kinase [Streptomyces sp. A3M-1-3]|uniref:serine/threonine-protein kinase n=1 Tax=Streptomyces sp. A3M-1-3 TaxID=2962044 RepID=UPI0020B7A248|nr:serine/threonine-protein kinase [Streptomyces sp. A3M-1-3]MCP3816583.1 serine/threonine protein kinase [Streptomyces sp. A3M-1-3]